MAEKKSEIWRREGWADGTPRPGGGLRQDLGA